MPIHLDDTKLDKAMEKLADLQNPRTNKHRLAVTILQDAVTASKSNPEGWKRSPQPPVPQTREGDAGASPAPGAVRFPITRGETSASDGLTQPPADSAAGSNPAPSTSCGGAAC